MAEGRKASAAATQGATARESRFEPRVPGVRYGVLDELVGYALRRAQIKLYEDFVDSLSAWDVTPQRFAALVIVAENSDLKLTELARVMGVARSGAVSLVDFLAERDYVARFDAPNDKRALQLRITPNGQRVLASITDAVRSHDARIVGMLTTAEQAKLMSLLRRMVGL